MSGRPLALVTGSSRGIGYGIAGGLLAAGYDVVISGRDPAKLAISRGSLADSAAAGAVHAKPFDVTEPDAVGEAVAEIEARIGAIEALVNNAGIVERGALLRTGLDQWNSMLAAHATAPFTLSTRVAERMIPRRRGKIVNIGSIQGTRSRRGVGAYAAAKAALEALTRSMCAEWGGHNIQINTVAPGYILTEMNHELRDDPVFTEWLMERTPAGRWEPPTMWWGLRCGCVLRGRTS